MPRHVPRIPILRLESLSTGQPIDMTGPQVDDFTGEPITRVWPDARPVGPLPSAQDILDDINRDKHRVNQLLLQAGGIIPKPTPAQVPACASPKAETA